MSKRAFFGGLAVFAMFFGSGNLIFPLVIGKEAHGHWIIALLGLAATGVIIPLFSLFCMLLLNKNMEFFFEILFKKTGATLASLLILLLCGPLGVIPRCVTVAQGAWKTFNPNGNAIIFAGACCFVLWLCVYLKSNLVDVIGKFFTPIKLFSLLTIIFSSIVVSSKLNFQSELSDSTAQMASSFLSGIINGYSTMDLFSALFFAPTLVAYFKNKNSSPKQSNRDAVIGMSFGFFLILFIYTCLIYLGSIYAPYLTNVPFPEILPTIVNLALGKYSYIMISFTLIIATVITAIALLSVTVDYLCQKINYLSNKRTSVLTVSVLITFLFAILGFQSIMLFLIPILKILYPVTVFIMILNFIKYGRNRKNKKDDLEIKAKPQDKIELLSNSVLRREVTQKV